MQSIGAADARARGPRPVASHQGELWRAGAGRPVFCSPAIPGAVRPSSGCAGRLPLLARTSDYFFCSVVVVVVPVRVPSLVASCAPLLTPLCASRASFLTPFCSPASPFLTPLGTRLRRICGRRRRRGGRRGGLGFSLVSPSKAQTKRPVQIQPRIQGKRVRCDDRPVSAPNVHSFSGSRFAAPSEHVTNVERPSY